jgi:transcriptional regulator with XRE-family HTH domain
VSEWLIAMKRRLKILRFNKGLSQQETAKKAGLSINMVAMIENGDYMPSLRVLFKLCEALDTSPEEVFAKVITL